MTLERHRQEHVKPSTDTIEEIGPIAISPLGRKIRFCRYP
jgi:hypothetical protein